MKSANFENVNTPTMAPWLILNYQGDITKCRFGNKCKLALYTSIILYYSSISIFKIQYKLINLT